MEKLEQKTFLVSAYACEPGKGSEPGVGWNWVIELSKKAKVIVITRSNNRESIEARKHETEGLCLKFYYCDLPEKIRFWKKKKRGLHLYYFFWQIVCYQLAKSICRSHSVDYAMSLTFGNMWLPTFMHKLPCEFIWGPLGGGEGVPKRLLTAIDTKKRIIETVRRINKHVPITNPWFNSICRKAKLIMVRTNDSLNCIPQSQRHKCELILETGVNQNDIYDFDERFKQFSEKQNGTDLMICGVLESNKMVGLAVDMMEKLIETNENVKLHIVGDGPEKEMLSQKITKKCLGDYIILHGRKTRDETLALMASCKALILPSSHEGGSWVMFEAMLLRKPIICFKTSGMEVVVTDETGIRIPVCDYVVAVEAFAEATKKILHMKDNQMGEKAYYRVAHDFLWESKITRMLERLQ